MNQGSSKHAVLIVDDDSSVARMLRVLLEAEDFDVRIAADGSQALQTVSSFRPDLVLLDLQMPVMDGRTFYKEFRSLGYTSPVIILSAYNADSARQELGAEDAVGKPFEPDRIVERVRRLLNGLNR